MYLFATENLVENYKFLPIKGNSVLTACASGDQVFDMLLYKPKDLIGFDLNPACKHTFNIKIAALKTLNYQEFSSFFDNKSPDLLDYHLYKKLNSHLALDTKRYFDNLYLENNMDGRKIYDVKFRKRLRGHGCNKYTSNKMDFMNIRKLIRAHLSFILSDVLELHKEKALKLKKFDLIYLSNIPSYLQKPESFKGDIISYFNDIVLKNLSKLLKEDGIIAYCEVNSFFDKNDKIPLIVSPKAIKKIKEFGDFKVELKKVKGYYDKRKYDILLILKPIFNH